MAYSFQIDRHFVVVAGKNVAHFIIVSTEQPPLLQCCMVWQPRCARQTDESSKPTFSSQAWSYESPHSKFCIFCVSGLQKNQDFFNIFPETCCPIFRCAKIKPRKDLHRPFISCSKTQTFQWIFFLSTFVNSVEQRLLEAVVQDAAWLTVFLPSATGTSGGPH